MVIPVYLRKSEPQHVHEFAECAPMLLISCAGAVLPTPNGTVVAQTIQFAPSIQLFLGFSILYCVLPFLPVAT